MSGLQEKRVSFFNFGCRLNQSESAMMANELKAAGAQVEDSGLLAEASDWYVINSCTVTNEASNKCKKLIRRLRSNYPQAKIALVGCLPQAERAPEKLDADLILGTVDKFQLLKNINEFEKNSHKRIQISKDSKSGFSYNFQSDNTNRTRVSIKIQDGCDFFCSFCIVPFARGRARSRSMADVLLEAKGHIDNGFQELVLTGVNLGTFMDGANNFIALLKELLALPGLGRIRLSSIEPQTVGLELLHLMADNKTKFAPFLHLPLQSASDDVLSVMRRKYTIADFDKYITYAKKIMPSVCVGTDIIVGFPSESESDFLQTINYFENSNLNFAHVFPYSKRFGTVAGKMPEEVPAALIKQRAEVMRNLSNKKWTEFCTSQLNTIQTVLFEQELAKNLWQGYSANYIRVRTMGQDLKNKLAAVKLQSLIEDNAVIAEAV